MVQTLALAAQAANTRNFLGSVTQPTSSKNGDLDKKQKSQDETINLRAALEETNQNPAPSSQGTSVQIWSSSNKELIVIQRLKYSQSKGTKSQGTTVAKTNQTKSPHVEDFKETSSNRPQIPPSPYFTQESAPTKHQSLLKGDTHKDSQLSETGPYAVSSEHLKELLDRAGIKSFQKTNTSVESSNPDSTFTRQLTSEEDSHSAPKALYSADHINDEALQTTVSLKTKVDFEPLYQDHLTHHPLSSREGNLLLYPHLRSVNQIAENAQGAISPNPDSTFTQDCQPAPKAIDSADHNDDKTLQNCGFTEDKR
ncbi:hypothetical protein BY996DRAFT_6418101 [Phakopsora pachyrhizi]|nr:hypothetical protein BY996DRAFT_6418101 [Phakopsora pachyrhizi]